MKKILSLLAISFSLAFAYTAADVYGAWSANGTLNNALRQAVYGEPVLLFEKSGLDKGQWRFNGGIITFSNSTSQCQMISAKVMDCYLELTTKLEGTIRKITYKKAGTVAQYNKIAEQEDKEVEKRLAEKEKEAEKERAERQKQDSIREYNNKISNQPFYKSLEQTKKSLQQIYDEHKNATKGEFESTADFDKRKAELDKNLKDSSVFYFNSALISIVDVIENDTTFKFDLAGYDADKQIFDVAFEKEAWIYRLKINGKVKMPPEIAKSLKENKKQFSFRYKNADLRNVDYFLMPIKMGIYGTNGNEYIVDFDIPNTAKEIVFNSAELWKDNPYAKDLSVSLAEAMQLKEAAVNKVKAAEAAVANKAAEEQKKRDDIVKKGLTDPRDNKKYKLVEIGSQIWMAENLNYDAKDSKCYDNKPDNCKKYGRLYNWNMAKSACPSGWHLPSDAEFNVFYPNLRNVMAGKEDKAKENLNAFSARFGGKGEITDTQKKTDKFSALLSGKGNSNDRFSFIEGICYGNMGCQVGRGFWWSSSTDKNAAEALGKTINDGRFIEMNGVSGDKTKDLYSVRCVMD